MKLLRKAILVTLGVLLLASCSPYASVDVGAPFKVGPVYVNPRIGVGSW
ncbi:MAG: hypothetical protein ACK5NC_13965 [Vibrio sp.]